VLYASDRWWVRSNDFSCVAQPVARTSVQFFEAPLAPRIVHSWFMVHTGDRANYVITRARARRPRQWTLVVILAGFWTSVRSNAYEPRTPHSRSPPVYNLRWQSRWFETKASLRRSNAGAARAMMDRSSVWVVIILISGEVDNTVRSRIIKLNNVINK